MRPGLLLIIVLLGVVTVSAGIYLYLNQGNTSFSQEFNLTDRKTPKPSVVPQSYSIGSRKNTTPNDTSNWRYFSSELYKYSLRYPTSFKLLLGNVNLFQATSNDYAEENGVITTGALAQAVGTDRYESFENAWGDIDESLEHLGITILSKEETTVDNEQALKLRLENTDGTTEIRYLTYKSPYSFKISIVVGKNSQASMDDYEQILDDIITTFNF